MTTLNRKWDHTEDHLDTKTLTMMGIEPTIFRFEVGRLIHWATRPIAMASSHPRSFPY